MANYWGGGPGGMRAADADRERAVDVLKAGFAEGRLTREEYEQRTGRVLASRTYGELAALVADLPQGPLSALPAPPSPPPGSAPAPYPPPYAPPYRVPAAIGPANGLAVAALLCGLGGLLLVFPAVPAIVLGHRARGRLRVTGENGEAAATAGVVLGYLALGFWALILLGGG